MPDDDREAEARAFEARMVRWFDTSEVRDWPPAARRRAGRKVKRWLWSWGPAYQRAAKRMAAHLRAMPETTPTATPITRPYISLEWFERSERALVEKLRGKHPDVQRQVGQIMRDAAAKLPADYRDVTMRATAGLMGEGEQPCED